MLWVTICQLSDDHMVGFRDQKDKEKVNIRRNPKAGTTQRSTSDSNSGRLLPISVEEREKMAINL